MPQLESLLNIEFYHTDYITFKRVINAKNEEDSQLDVECLIREEGEWNLQDHNGHLWKLSEQNWSMQSAVFMKLHEHIDLNDLTLL